MTPPTVNRKTNPMTHRIAGVHNIGVPLRVATQLKILIPVGMEITIVAEVK